MKKYNFKDNYNIAYTKAFQEINKEILDYIVEKYEINREFINNFYEDFQSLGETYHITYDYIYLFIKDSFGDLLINKYTMAKFIILSEIVENILEANFEWYVSTINCGIIHMNKIIGFDIFNYDFNELTSVIDFLFIKNFNRYESFRKYYLFRRIEQLTDYKFIDQSHYIESLDDYKSCNEKSFYSFYRDNCIPWMQYYEYYELDEDETKERFIDDDYLGYYELIKTTRKEPLFYECNIVDIDKSDDKINDELDSDSD